MRELVVVRHGESEGNVRGLAQGALPFPLTERGRAQVAAAARVIERLGWRPDTAVTSPVERCVQSASLLAGALGLPPAVAAPAFTEIDSGSGTGRPFRDLIAETPGLLDRDGLEAGGFEALGGETGAALLARVGAGLDALPAAARVLLVTHGAVVKACMAHLLRLPPRFWLDLRPATILRLERIRVGDAPTWSLTHFLHPDEEGGPDRAVVG